MGHFFYKEQKLRCKHGCNWDMNLTISQARFAVFLMQYVLSGAYFGFSYYLEIYLHILLILDV